MYRARALMIAVVLLTGCASSQPGVVAEPPTPSLTARPAQAGLVDGAGSVTDLAADDPYPIMARFFPTVGRTERLIRASTCRGGKAGLRLLAVMATGPADDREVLSLVETAICEDGLSSPRPRVSGGSWARTSRGRFATVRRTPDLTDEAVLYSSAGARRLSSADGYSTNIPVPFDDGSVAFTVATDRGMRVDLLGSTGRPQTLMTSPSTVNGFDYSPSGQRFVALERVGGAGVAVGSRLTVADAHGVRRHTLALPSAVSLLVLDERTAVIGDITDRPGAASVLVDLDTGATRPLAVGLFALAFDAQGRRLLMRDRNGSLSWLSRASGLATPIAAAAKWRVVGGDLLR